AGHVFVGANVENAAYPEGICAEASAIAAMVAAGEREIDQLVTVCGDDVRPSLADTVGTCCGGCRQKIREFATSTTVVHNADPMGIRRSFTIDALLPGSFGPGHLLD
ncbi:MAG: cytidine deaminase, partial [Ilumatobacter sp.]|nr:cytidine deaminase [Ilumatobacter sp.]